MRIVAAILSIGFVFGSAVSAEEEIPEGLPSLLADQITGITVVSYNEAPAQVREPSGHHWTWDNYKGEALFAQTRCAGYHMVQGGTWRYCELSPADGAEPEYFWQDDKGNLVIGPVAWD